MSIAEIAHRTYRAARHPLDRVRMRTGLYARTPTSLATWHRPARFYSLDGIPVNIDAADRICRGQREVLGLGWLDLPDAPWHLEPLASAEWPRVDATRVISAGPSHFDARLTWELNRGHDWVTLARAHAATREPRYAERLSRDLASWRAANPIGIGINWASAMEAAIRIHSLAWVAGLVGGDPALAAMLHEHAKFVAHNLSRYSSANNHLIVELSGICVAERVLHGTPHTGALAELDVEIDRQIFDDGVSVEMATHYHAFVLEALMLVAQLERVFDGPRAKLEAVIARMAEYLWHLRTADGSLLQQGDSDDGKILPWHADPFAFIPPQSTPMWSRAFRTSGQVVLRSERLHVTFDAGPFGFGTLAAHAHCDALAINVAIDGRPFLVDRGTYRYNGDPAARDRYRMTAAHNTLQVNGREQGETAGPFLWRRQPSVTLERCELGGDVEVVVAIHDGFSPAIHRRSVLLCDTGLVIVDHIVPPQPVTVRWQLAPRAHAQVVESEVALRDDATSLLLWTTASDVRCVGTTHSEFYGAELDALTIEYASDEATVTTVLASSASDIDRALRLAHDRFSDAPASRSERAYRSANARNEPG